jgi:hypothetical protein
MRIGLEWVNDCPLLKERELPYLPWYHVHVLRSDMIKYNLMGIWGSTSKRTPDVNSQDGAPSSQLQ